VSAESDLYTALSGAAAVTAIVSTRIYPDVVPQEQTIPSVAFARIGTQYERTIHSATPIMQTATLEIACMDDKRADAEALADAVVTAAAGSGFRVMDRRAELDSENGIWATVLTVEHDS
jgi:hypothetical protein